MPPVPATGVPLSIPVAGLKVTSDGNAPDSVSVATGKPMSATEKLPPVPTEKVVLPALVMAGALSTVSTKLCVAAVRQLAAVNVRS